MLPSRCVPVLKRKKNLFIFVFRSYLCSHFVFFFSLSLYVRDSGLWEMPYMYVCYISLLFHWWGMTMVWINIKMYAIGICFYESKNRIRKKKVFDWLLHLYYHSNLIIYLSYSFSLKSFKCIAFRIIRKKRNLL